jgi:hypothetical protein
MARRIIGLMVYPLFVVENETGEVTRYSDYEQTVCFVEEFWDVLSSEFKIWDNEGFPIGFCKGFLEGDEESIQKGKEEQKRIVARHIISEGLNKHKITNEDILDLNISSLDLLYNRVMT